MVCVCIQRRLYMKVVIFKWNILNCVWLKSTYTNLLHFQHTSHYVLKLLLSISALYIAFAKRIKEVLFISSLYHTTSFIITFIIYFFSISTNDLWKKYQMENIVCIFFIKIKFYFNFTNQKYYSSKILFSISGITNTWDFKKYIFF